jgi:hypothetical protein
LTHSRVDDLPIRRFGLSAKFGGHYVPVRDLPTKCIGSDPTYPIEWPTNKETKMRSARIWLYTGIASVALAGLAMLSASLPSVSTAAEARAPREHWHYHDGHWSYWDDTDHLWYYTDGAHWFYNDHDAWKVYKFDKHWGKEGFEHGEYHPPRVEEKVIIPHHKLPR